MNTPENRDRFTAQYWGQKIARLVEFNHELLYINDYSITTPKEKFLELTPLSSITDEDAIEVSRIWGSKVDSRIIGESIVNRLAGRWSDIETQFRNILGVVDYLRLKGYALPWMGITVEQQIEFGWVKLKEV